MANFQQDIVQLMQAKFRRLNEVWNDIGYDTAARASRENLVKQYLLEMLDDTISEEESTKMALVVSIESLLQESFQLSSEIGEDVSLDNNEYEQLPLFHVERQLKSKVSQFRSLKQERVSRYEALRQQESECCKLLGIEQKEKLPNCVPTEDQLADFEAYVRNISAEKNSLNEYFVRTRSEIMGIMKELEMAPFLEFEQKIFSEDETTFEMTTDNIRKLRELHESLVLKLDCTKALAAELRDKLNKLWDLLYEDQETRLKFLESHRGHSLCVIAALKLEVRRCEQVKQQNFKTLVDRFRMELAILWNKCCIGEAQRRKFFPYFSDCYTEDLLELHELEMAKVKRYLDRHADVFALMEKRRELWDRMVDLQERASDQSRLFDNRGGRLLLEEKERREIQKQMSKIEKRMLELVARRSSETLLFFDMELQDYLDEQWREIGGQRSNRKMQTGSQSAYSLRPRKRVAETPTTTTPRVLFGRCNCKRETPQCPTKRPRLDLRDARAVNVFRTPRSAPSVPMRRPPFRT